MSTEIQTKQAKVRRISMSGSWRRLSDHMGFRPHTGEIAAVIGIDPSEVSQVLGEGRKNPRLQKAIANWAGMSVGELFGDAAWFRVAAKKLEALLREEAEDAS